MAIQSPALTDTALTQALQSLQRSLGTTSPYTLGSSQLTGTNLFSLLQTYLQVSSSGLAITATSPPSNVGGNLVLSGTCNVLGMNQAQVTATFIDSIGGDNSDVRGVDLLMTVSPASSSSWRFSQSFGQLAGTFFDNLTVSNPTFVFSSQANLPVQPAGTSQSFASLFGLSMSGQVALSGPLAQLASLADSGVSSTQPFYGPINFTTDSTPKPLLALAFVTPLTVTLSGFPSGAGLAVSLQTSPTSTGVSAEVQLAVPMTVSGINGAFPLTGTLPNTAGPVTLQYQFAVAPPVTVNNLNPWSSSQPTVNALPQPLRAQAFTLNGASMQLQSSPTRQVNYVEFDLATTYSWQLASGVNLNAVEVTLHSTSAQALSCSVCGYIPITDSTQPGATTGVNLAATSDSGFPLPYAFSQTTGAAVLPSLKPLVTLVYPAWGAALPAGLSALGTAYALNSFSAAMSSTGLGLSFAATATSTTAAWSLMTTPASLSMTNLSLTVATPAGGSSTATVQGKIGLGNPVQYFRFQTQVTGSTFTAYTFTLQDSTLTMGPLATTLCGPNTPSWMTGFPFASGGTLTVTSGSSTTLSGSLTTSASTWSVPQTNTGTSQLQSFTGVTIATSSGAISITVGATWNVRDMTYVGSLAYPFTQFTWSGGTIPIPEAANPPQQPDPNLAATIISATIVTAGAAMTLFTVGSAIYATYQTAGYAVPAAAGQAWPAIGRFVVQLRTRAKLLVGGLLLVYTGVNVWLMAAIAAKQGSNNEIQPADSVAGLQDRGATVSEAGYAVTQAYSLDGPGLAQALAPFYQAVEVAPVLKQSFASTYPTAQTMATQLVDPNVYASTLTPRQMTAALAAAGYPVTQVAPAIKQQYPQQAGTAALLAPILQGGYQDANVTLSAQDMASGLAACNFSLLTVAPAELPLYTSVSLPTMATNLVAGFQAVAPPSGMQLTMALAAAGQTAAAVQPAVLGALPGLTTDQWNAISAAAYDTNEAAIVTLALQKQAAGLTAAQTATAILTAYPQVALNLLTGVLYSVYSPPNQSASVLATAVKQGYLTNPPSASAISSAVTLSQAPTALTARQMTATLAAAGYTVVQVAPAIAQQYPQQAGTAALLAPILQGGFQDAGITLSARDLTSGLVACNFSLVQIAPAVVPLYPSESLNNLAADLSAPFANTQAPASGMQLGIGLAAAGKSSTAVSPALLYAMPTITASQMTGILAAVYDSDEAGALALALQKQSAGQTAAQASAAIVQATPQIGVSVLAGVLYGVFSPPNLGVTPLAQAVVAGTGTGVDPTALGQALPLCVVPASLTATVVAQALVAAVPSISAVSVATALKADGYSRSDAYAALTAVGFSQDVANQAIIQVYGGTAVRLVGSGSYVQMANLADYAIGTGDFALEIWVQATTAQGGVLICHQGPSTQHNPGFLLQANSNGLIGFAVGASSGSYITYQNMVPVTLFDNRPHYLAAVRQTTGSTTTMSLYLDGQVLQGTPSSPARIDVTSTVPLYVGLPTGTGLGTAWNGYVWNVCLWNVALSAQTVANHAAAGGITAPQTGLIGYWPFNDGTANDGSGKGNNGTLLGGATIGPIASS